MGVVNTENKDTVLYCDVAFPQSLVAVSKVFAQARKSMNAAELKTFIYALSSVDWRSNAPNVVYLDKKKLAEILDINSDYNHLSGNLKRAICKLPEHSLLEFEGANGYYSKGFFIYRLDIQRNYVRLKFDDEWLSAFGNLERDYITLWSSDIFGMKSERSIAFYENLRLNSDTRITNSRIYTVKNLKDMFRIPFEGSGSYVKPDGKFNRPVFEERVIDPLIDDLLGCRMIQLLPYEDDSYCKKIKDGNKVLGYEVQWVVNNPKNIECEDENAEPSDSDNDE